MDCGCVKPPTPNPHSQLVSPFPLLLPIIPVPLSPLISEMGYSPILLSKLWLFLLSFCLSLLALSSASAQQTAERRLRYVQAIWRHGDRAPKRKPYEADIYDEKYWPRGWNQLTQLGMRQMHELGQFLRSRYVGGPFLSEDFDRKELFIRSTAVDRAIESAQSLLSGMFPPPAKEQFNAGLSWQPIPVHSAIDGQPDPLLRPSSFACPHYQKLKKAVKEELEDELMPKYKELAESLRPVLNIPEEQPVKLRSITELKSIQMEILHNLTQPDWVFKRWPKYGNRSTLDLVLELRDRERVAEFNGSNELARLSGGYLLGDWLRRAKKLANSNSSERLQPAKMVLYSAHDGTLLSLLSAIRAKGTPLKMPPFASCLIMEIFEKRTGKFDVELHFRQNGQLQQILADGCTKSCSLEDFVAITEGNAIFEADSLYEKCGARRCMLTSHSMGRAFSSPLLALCCFFLLPFLTSLPSSKFI